MLGALADRACPARRPPASSASRRSQLLLAAVVQALGPDGRAARRLAAAAARPSPRRGASLIDPHMEAPVALGLIAVLAPPWPPPRRLYLGHFAFLGLGADLPAAAAPFGFLALFGLTPLAAGALGVRTRRIVAGLLILAALGCAAQRPVRRAGGDHSRPMRAADQSRFSASAPSMVTLRSVMSPVVQRIDPAVHAERLAARPGVLDEDVGGDVAHLADHVQLAEPVETRCLVADGFELVAMVVMHLADRVQPVVDQAAPLAVDRRAPRRRSRSGRPP